MLKFKTLLSVVFLFVISIGSAQITSSSVTGSVVEGSSPVGEASITLIHLPTNSSFETTTNKQGRFSFDNLNVGGPYKIIVKAIGFEDYTNSLIQLSLGDNDLRSVKLEKKVNTLEEVTVVGKKTLKNGKRNGSDTAQTKKKRNGNVNQNRDKNRKIIKD